MQPRESCEQIVEEVAQFGLIRLRLGLVGCRERRRRRKPSRGHGTRLDDARERLGVRVLAGCLPRTRRIGQAKRETRTQPSLLQHRFEARSHRGARRIVCREARVHGFEGARRIGDVPLDRLLIDHLLRTPALVAGPRRFVDLGEPQQLAGEPPTVGHKRRELVQIVDDILRRRRPCGELRLLPKQQMRAHLRRAGLQPVQRETLGGALRGVVRVGDNRRSMRIADVAAALRHVRQLVFEQLPAVTALRGVLAGTEDDMPPDVVRSRTHGGRRLSGFLVAVHADVAEVMVQPNACADIARERLTRRAQSLADQRLGAAPRRPARPLRFRSKGRGLLRRPSLAAHGR